FRYSRMQKIKSEQVEYAKKALIVIVSVLFIYLFFNEFEDQHQTEPIVVVPKAENENMTRYELGQRYYVYPKARTNTRVSINIVVINTAGTKLENYEKAKNSLECYVALHGYNLFIEVDNKFEECAHHKDKFFRRHCHVHKLMETKMKEGDWVLVIDGDVGVINPKRLIEEYLEHGYEIYLVNRFYFWEYAMSNYIVKNNLRGRDWVDELAKWEFKLPQSMHGTDNGALHIFMMNYLVPETRDPKTRTRMAKLCYSLWERSVSWDDVFSMEACARMVIGERVYFPEQKVKIYNKGEGMARDLWIFHSHWAPDDFMFHSLKEENFTPFPENDAGQQRCRQTLLKYHFNNSKDEPCHMVFPILKKLNVERCKNGTEGWLMEGRLEIDNETRKKVYDKIAYQQLKEQMEHVGKTAGKIERMWMF
ncbi:hypothetical protein PENTCL1PPCAC_29822, partial [Pristionchus entomophagus]